MPASEDHGRVLAFANAVVMQVDPFAWESVEREVIQSRRPSLEGRIRFVGPASTTYVGPSIHERPVVESFFESYPSNYTQKPIDASMSDAYSSTWWIPPA